MVALALVNTASAVAGPVHKSVRYQCESPGQESAAVTVEVDARFPDRGTTGAPISVSDLSFRTAVPEGVVTAWRDEGATTVDAQARLDLSANQAGRQSATASPEWAVPSPPVPGSGALPFTGTTGPVPVTVDEAGDTAFMLGDLVLRVTPRDGDAKPTGPGTRELRCGPESGANTTLATIPVAGAEAPAGEHPRAPAPQLPVGITVPYGVKGASKTNKMNSDIKIGPGDMIAKVDVVGGTFEGDLTLPPSPGYFVLFGFVPSTATVEFIPVGPVRGVIELGNVEATSDIIIRLTDVTMGDVPVNVGSECQTVVPATLHFKSDPEFNPLIGGTMRTVFTLPEFGGCGVTEPMNDLFTGVVSGPDNTALLDLQVQL